MGERTRKLVILLAIYVLAFGIGFRTGDMYNRMKSKSEVFVVHTKASEPRRFYIVEGKLPGHEINFYTLTETDHIMRFYQIEKLRHLLKLKNIKIYNSKGKRIF